VPGLDVCCLFDVGDAAGYFEGAGAESLLSHGAFGQALAVGGELAESADGAGGQRLNRGAEGLVEHHERSTGDGDLPCSPLDTKA
jgi:hypothetical protein